MDLDRKSLASFRVLVAVAQADGNLADEERAALQSALGKHADLLDRLLSETVDVDQEIALLDDKARHRVYESAFALSYSDGHAAVDEVNLLKRLVPDEGERSFIGQVFGEARDTLLPAQIVATADPVQRDMEILEDILKYSVLAGVAGAMPVPGVAIVADLAVVALQAKMVHDIGQYWGHSMDMAQIRGFMGTVAGSAGVRIAVNNLARLVPGWGSAFGAATSFATTFAIGKVAERYFSAGRGMSQEELQGLFSEMKSQGRSVFADKQDDIEKAKAEHGDTIAALNEQLAHGEIDRAEYDRRIAAL